MISTEELIALGQYAVDKAKSLHVSECEVYLVSGNNTTVDIKNNLVQTSQSQTKSIIGIRAFIGKSSGSIAITTFDKESIAQAVEEVIKVAKIAPPDESFHHLLQFDEEPKYPRVLGLYDPSLEKFNVEELIDLGEIMINTAISQDSRSIVEGGSSVSNSAIAIVNSHGIAQGEKFSSASISCQVNIKVSDTNVGSGGDFYIDRKITELKTKSEQVSEKAVEKAQLTLNPQKIEGAEYPVIIHGRNVYSWLGTVIDEGINARSLYDGESYFSDRLGSKVLAEGLSVVDNPIYPGGFESAPFDDEGAPTSKMELINKDGILNHFITDSYTAYALDLPVTGHASRGNPAGTTRPSIHQLHVNAGADGTLEQMIQDMKKGIYIESSLTGFGLKGVNLSEKLNRAFYVENGQIKHSIKDAMIASDVFTFLMGISGISSELVDEFGRKTPHLEIKGMVVSGAK